MPRLSSICSMCVCRSTVWQIIMILQTKIDFLFQHPQQAN